MNQELIVQQLYDLFVTIFEDQRNPNLEIWLKKHSSLINKLDFIHENEYYKLIYVYLGYN